MKKLERSFYRRTSLVLAKDLLGKYLIFNYNNQKLVGKIIETEAYMGFNDKAAHTYNGRRTPRVETMYGEEGHAYVYIIYGMYNCFNVVAAEKEIAQAVLIRALEPIEGFEAMSLNRFKKPFNQLNKSQVISLTNGPGKLCSAFGITREMNGEDLTRDRLYICSDTEEKFHIVETTRVGIDYAEEAKDFPWRFYIKDNRFISRP
ncbi:DNA-3-methyladenine glycosylase [Proteiniborus sp. MB09-C3]|uniref:DNA-3-methyladenine glycosylase n=1 Tax=Proteiniborus sp. MB09-C3 TaxID=3050072 RepID=UPI0025544BD1|nr:DNA-3-methyladenine glycosylase [Proteiniborus sp. MB09-C3]WIV13831.1 DNA-3-methyladenine glycosylase [Proteiniborus sp. MB09-C3]